jgi:hypothetical protein
LASPRALITQLTISVLNISERSIVC